MSIPSQHIASSEWHYIVSFSTIDTHKTKTTAFSCTHTFVVWIYCGSRDLCLSIELISKINSKSTKPMSLTNKRFALNFSTNTTELLSNKYPLELCTQNEIGSHFELFDIVIYSRRIWINLASKQIHKSPNCLKFISSHSLR